MKKVLCLLFVLLMMTAAGVAERTSQVVGKIQIDGIPDAETGITVTDIKVSDRYICFTVKNETDHPLSGHSYFDVKVYDNSGVVTDSGILTLDGVNQGQSCKTAFYVPKRTARVEIGDVELFEGKHVENNIPTQKVDKVLFNVLPFDAGGMSIELNNVNRTRVRGVLTNNTGKPISSSSCVYYKCYGADGEVLSDDVLFAEDLNPDETCKLEFYTEDQTKKVRPIVK